MNRTGKVLYAMMLSSSLAWFCGCTQSQHRINADREAYCTIAERNGDPRWKVNNVGIDMDSRSRYFDPYNPDASPMPADDPASHRYMHCVDGKKGWSHWHDNGVRASLENPRWRARLGEYSEVTDQGAVKLDVDSAIRLAYLHSPLHQQNLETLYLSSLDVTGERFRLDTQFFSGNDIVYNHQGNVAPSTIVFDPGLGQYRVSGPFNVTESNRLMLDASSSASRRTATAGELLVGFANTLAFEFTGNDVSLASSLANFSLIQPLLRGAGRDVALEQLTLSERRLLSNLRAYSQFRQGFFTQVVIGELGVTGPNRAGANTNLQSFSGFGGVNGYLGLLQQAQQIRNTEDNLRLQLRTLDRLEALYDNELIDIVQVDQFRQNIEVTRANLLDQTNALELAIDNYKTGILGLPPDLLVDIDEELVKGFQLIPIESNPILESLLDLQVRIGDIGELSDLELRAEQLTETISGLADEEIEVSEIALIRLQGVVEAVGRRLKLLKDDIASLQSGAPEGSASLGLPPASMDEITSRIEEDFEAFQNEFDDAAIRLETILDGMTDDNFKDLITESTDWFNETLALCREIIDIQSRARNLSAEPDLVIEEIQKFVDPVRELFANARSDVDRMDTIAEERESTMRDDEKLRFKKDRERLNQRLDDLENGEVGLNVALEELEQIRADYTDENRAKTVRSLTAWILTYIQLVERLALIPAQARLEVITVEDVELEPEAAFQIALNHRLDFMNGRAALVDSWRAIQVAADALQSNLSVTASGTIDTARNNPVDFRASTSSLRLGLEFDAPLARLLERNGYRESLINYQRNRRNLIQSHDSLQLGLRALLRTLKQRRLQLDIQRRAVAIALRRVDQTQLSLLSPPPQGQPGVRPQINPTVAINLLSAQGSLQSSQNSFLAAWLNYYAARLRLFRELGVMHLDPSGRWIETAFDFGNEPQPTPDDPLQTLPPQVPLEDLEVKMLDQDNLSGASAETMIAERAEVQPGQSDMQHLERNLIRLVSGSKTPRN